MCFQFLTKHWINNKSLMPDLRKNNFENFLKISSIHGLKYLVNMPRIPLQRWENKPIWGFLSFVQLHLRIFWLFLLLIVSCLFAILTFEIFVKFQSNQTVIKVSKRQYLISEINFPAVTICPEIAVFDADRKYEWVVQNLIFITNFEVWTFENFLNSSAQHWKEYFTMKLKLISTWPWINIYKLYVRVHRSSGFPDAFSAISLNISEFLSAQSSRNMAFAKLSTFKQLSRC